MKKQFLSLAMIFACMTVILSCKKSSPSTVPTAAFSYSGAGLAPSTVQFTNNSTVSADYLWDFGDNTTSHQASPSHVYTKGGIYTVTLTVSKDGATSKATKTVNIQSPTSVKIISISVTQMPFLDTNGSSWDNNSGPDVYFTFADNASNILFTSPVINDILPSSLPLLWTLSPTYQITNFATNYQIAVYDKDSPDPDDYIGGYSFNLSTLPNSGYPTTYTIQTSGSPLQLKLTLQWQ